MVVGSGANFGVVSHLKPGLKQSASTTGKARVNNGGSSNNGHNSVTLLGGDCRGPSNMRTGSKPTNESSNSIGFSMDWMEVKNNKSKKARGDVVPLNRKHVDDGTARTYPQGSRFRALQVDEEMAPSEEEAGDNNVWE